MRDYFDFLAPYLRLETVHSPEWRDFWMDEVLAARVPRNRIQSLTAFFQHAYRPTPGNALDQAHACGLLECDVFLTCDRSFGQVIGHLREHFDDLSDLAILDRSAEKPSKEIAGAIG